MDVSRFFFGVESAGFFGPSHLYLGDFELPASREGSTRHKMENAQSKGGVVNNLLASLVTKTLQTLLRMCFFSVFFLSVTGKFLT